MTAKTQETSLSVVEGLASQARALRMNINVNMWQLARVFTEAKELVPHGEWEQWLAENADVSVRTAQDMMAAYKRFGGKLAFEGLGQSKIFKLLPLPEEKEAEFMETHDVSNMSTREVQEAVRQARAEAEAEIQKEREARLAAERRAKEAENRPAETMVPPELTEELSAAREKIAQQEAEVDRLAALGGDMLTEQQRLAKENSELQREIQERDELLADQQEAIDQAQREVLDMRSAMAKGDAERVPANQLTCDAFASAVRAFIGTCARMPQMRSTFSGMALSEKEEYSTLLATVEKWCEDSRRALESTAIEGTMIYHE